MNFTTSPYEAMMKKPPYSAPGSHAGSQGLPLPWLPLLAGDRLPVLLPGLAETSPQGREVMRWSVS